MSLVLHLHPLSSYCQKVVVGLHELDAPFEAITVNLMDPSARAAFESLWPTAKIPLMEDKNQGRVIPESSIMLEYAQRYARKGATLLPSDLDAQLEARLWDRLFDNYVMTPMQKLVGDRIRPETERDARVVAEARNTLQMAYGMIDRHMSDRTWAVCEEFSLADCAAAPSLFYAGIASPWSADLQHLAAYFERLLGRESVRRALADARPHFEYFPFRDAMPARFLREDLAQS